MNSKKPANHQHPITCSMCGTTYEPGAISACQACPVNKGCSLTCCPQCGYENVNVEHSHLARWAGRWFGRRHQQRHHRRHCLADVPPGKRTRVIDFTPDLPAERRAQLQAYGLTPGYTVRVLAHSPVTIIQIDHTELALENDLAEQVEVGD